MIRVLIVDGDPVAMAHRARILESHANSIIAFENSTAALLWLEDSRSELSLVITNWELRGASGREIYEAAVGAGASVIAIGVHPDQVPDPPNFVVLPNPSSDSMLLGTVILMLKARGELAASSIH